MDACWIKNPVGQKGSCDGRRNLMRDASRREAFTSSCALKYTPSKSDVNRRLISFVVLRIFAGFNFISFNS